MLDEAVEEEEAVLDVAEEEEEEEARFLANSFSPRRDVGLEISVGLRMSKNEHSFIYIYICFKINTHPQPPTRCFWSIHYSQKVTRSSLELFTADS
jgi:hypothetical protein